jgi:hypothetical protein
MTPDVDACLTGLRELYENTTPPASPRGEKPVQRRLGSFGVGSESDAVTIARASVIEVHLLELFKSDYALDEEAEPEEASPQFPKQEKLPLSHLPHAFPCSATYKELPSPPSQWPQGPIMIRPTPFTSTKIRGIRRATSSDFDHFPGFCAGCILPVNNGSEKPGESLVIDFESSHFVGTLLMRIKQAPQNSNVTYQDQSYFDGKKRKFQGE